MPDEQLDTDLDRLLNVDRALWFRAVDNVLMDDDGYFSRGSDDSIEFNVQRNDVSWGRYPDGQGAWQPLPPTLGKTNIDK